MFAKLTKPEIVVLDSAISDQAIQLRTLAFKPINKNQKESMLKNAEILTTINEKLRQHENEKMRAFKLSPKGKTIAKLNKNIGTKV